MEISKKSEITQKEIQVVKTQETGERLMHVGIVTINQSHPCLHRAVVTAAPPGVGEGKHKKSPLTDAKRKLKLLKYAHLTNKPNTLAPMFVEYIRSMEVFRGEPCVFQCKVLGIPEPSIGWYFNDRELQKPGKYQTSEAGVSTFTVARVTAKDCGTYAVKASNSKGSALCVAQLTLSGLLTLTFCIISLLSSCLAVYTRCFLRIILCLSSHGVRHCRDFHCSFTNLSCSFFSFRISALSKYMVIINSLPYPRWCLRVALPNYVQVSTRILWKLFLLGRSDRMKMHSILTEQLTLAIIGQRASVQFHHLYLTCLQDE